jgi:ABC-type multidrug transport system ATPase subunit
MINTLEIDGVQLEFGIKKILSDVYVKCETGKITAILGRNGAGKSCFMQIAFGTMKAYSSSVRYNGKHVAKAHEIHGLLNYLPQFYFVPATMKVLKAFKYYGVAADIFTSRFPEYKKDMNKCMDELSGGQRRLIETYLILKADTLFTILDEPFSHIMPLHIEILEALIAEEKQRKGIIVTDHMYQHILDVSDTIYLINNGKTYPISDHNQLAEYGYVSYSAD